MARNWPKRHHHGLHFLEPEYVPTERFRSLLFFQTPWSTKCWKFIMEFLPKGTKYKLPTPTLNSHNTYCLHNSTLIHLVHHKLLYCYFSTLPLRVSSLCLTCSILSFSSLPESHFGQKECDFLILSTLGDISFPNWKKIWNAAAIINLENYLEMCQSSLLQHLLLHTVSPWISFFSSSSPHN